MRLLKDFLGLAVIPILCGPIAQAQQARISGKPPDLHGVYQSIPDGTTVAGGLKNIGAPVAIDLLPEAAQQAKAIDLKKDPWKMCQPVGPFRMMASQDTKIELVSVSSMIVMLFEDLSHGMKRIIYLKRSHPVNLESTWLGDSIGRWEGDTLMVDTIGFNDRTWLNEKGAQHSDALHLTEHVRPILDGEYLEYKMTAEDPKTLAKPYGYTRYYKRTTIGIVDDLCQDEE